jgi:hypothetical protein
MAHCSRHSDLNVVADDTNLVGAHWNDGGHTEHVARSHIELGTVTRALDGRAIQVTFTKRPAIVGAKVVNGIEPLAFNVSKGNRQIVHIYNDGSTRRNIGCFSNGYVF